MNLLLVEGDLMIYLVSHKIFSDSRQNQQDEENKEEVDLTSYIYKMPWSLNLAYSLTYNNSVGQNDFSTNSLMISSNLSLNP
jgi:hypothetical protein